MNAAEVLRAIRLRYPRNALITELTAPDVDCPRRIDALLFETRCRTAIEVKVSRADFHRETPEKRAPWRQITHRFVYATPVGLLSPGEIPAGCGLWEVDDRGIVTVVVRARRNPGAAPLPELVTQTLAYRAWEREDRG